MTDDNLTIGALANATGVKIETIRYYERIGLLPPPARTAGNYRAYGEAERNRLRFIRRSRDLGFAIAQVRTLLDLADDASHDCRDVESIARSHLDAVQRKIDDLSALRAELEDMIDHCGRATVAQCRIIRALATDRR